MSGSGDAMMLLILLIAAGGWCVQGESVCGGVGVVCGCVCREGMEREMCVCMERVEKGRIDGKRGGGGLYENRKAVMSEEVVTFSMSTTNSMVTKLYINYVYI